MGSIPGRVVALLREGERMALPAPPRPVEICGGGSGWGGMQGFELERWQRVEVCEYGTGEIQE